MNKNSRGSLSRSLWLKVRPGIARYRRNRVFRAISRLSDLWLKAYENCQGDFEKNGEEFVVRRLAKASIAVAFDVGANRGDWSLMARRHLPGAAIHAFELSAPTYARLVENTAGAGIAANHVGLSDRCEEVEFFHYPTRTGETSLLALPHQSAEVVRLKGRVTTGDEYCSAAGIKHIDLLKIDTEGHESAVLRGFGGMLAENRIDVIQFEYEKLNPNTKFLLKDYYALLAGHGYLIGKIYPTYVEFREYRFEHEMQWASNFLAIREKRSDLRKLLSG